MDARQGELPIRLRNPPLRSPATDWERVRSTILKDGEKDNGLL